MTMDSEVVRQVQLPSPGRLVELFCIDLTPLDPLSTPVYFYPGSKEDTGAGEILWQGNTYVPLPIKVEGVSVTSKGVLPRPKVSISNVMRTVTTILKAYGRIGGAVLTRWQVFSVFLDEGERPNPDGHLPVDIWIMDRVVSHNRAEVVIECRSLMDFSRRQAPARQILRNACSHTYRIYADGEFDYSRATCPYVGTDYFNELGQAVAASADKCGKKLIDCRLRFGSDPLPTRAFVGAGRYR